MRMLAVACALASTVAFAGGFREDPAKYWNFGELARTPDYRANPFPGSDCPGLKAMLVKGKGPEGSEAEFFAYYGCPAGPVPKGGFPGVVMVHGGNGTAFPNYVKLWIAQGFAVIALDWYNQRPVLSGEQVASRADLPGGKRNDILANVANITLTHSLLRSMPEVNKGRVAFVGLSWGSWYGAIVTAVDPRYAGAVEIFCGDVTRKSLQLTNGRFLHAAKCPMWWFVSTNDRNVKPSTSADGWNECAKLAGKTIVNDLPHSHGGFAFGGCMRMAKHFTSGEPSLPVLSDAKVANGRISATILDSGKGVDHAKIAWTESADPVSWKRTWRSAPAEVRDGCVRADVPARATQAYLAAYERDEGRFHEFCGTTSFVTLPVAEPAAERSWTIERETDGLARLTFDFRSSEVLTFEVAVGGQWVGSVPAPPSPSGRAISVSFDAPFRRGPNVVRISGARLPESIDCRVVTPVKTPGLETERWQELIDKTALRGGGRVTIPAGRHLVGGLELRNNIELHLEKDAVLEGAFGLDNYRIWSLPCSEGTWSAIVAGVGVTNVAITGEGEIFGNGGAWPLPSYSAANQEGLRPRGIFFADSRGVVLERFLLRDAACWGVVFKCVDGVRVRDVRIDSHANYNNDGFDVEARNAVFEGCDVDASDDAFVFKSNNPGFVTENILVTNCQARSHCYAYKFGTASHGTMRNVTFVDSKALPPRRDFLVGDNPGPDGGIRGKPFWFKRMGYDRYPSGCGGGSLAVECVDGGTVENILFENMELSGATVPLFVRGGTRTGRHNGVPAGDRHILRNVTFRNIRGEAAGWIASSISGVRGCRVENVTLENVDILCRGAGKTLSAEALSKPVPDVSGGYPCVNMFGHILPAYGLYIDQADGVTLRNATFRLPAGECDVRPPIAYGSGAERTAGLRGETGVWCYRPYEYEAWMLQRMRAEADRGVLHFSYPGKFLRLVSEPTAFYAEAPVEGYEPIPGAPDAPPHRMERPRTERKAVFADGVYDLGRLDIGYVFAKSDDRPNLFVGESLSEVRNSDANGFEQSVLMVPDGSDGGWRSDVPLALRYFRFGNGIQSCRFESQVDWREPAGGFACGDARKERLWRLGAETLRLCTRTFLVDGVKRDRLPWAGDLVVEIMSEAYTFGDAEPIKRTLAVLGSGDMSEGHVNGIAAFSLWWVVGHDLLQRYFGEADYLRRHYPRIKARMAEIATHEDERGFFAKELDWDFMDWTDRKGGSLKSEITRQVIYFGALKAAERLAKRRNDVSAAAEWAEKAERLRSAILSVGMDRTRHARILAIFFDLVDGETARRYAAEIAADDLPPTVTPYMSSFEVMALSKAGETAAAQKKFESVWGEMADFGVDAYWEGWDRADRGDEVYEYYGRPFAKSLCHAWASGPAFLIPGVFLGVRPTADGWTSWEAKPEIPSFAPNARVSVPVPGASIEVRFLNGLREVR